MRAKLRKIKFIKPNKSIVGKFVKKVFGIELNRKKHDGFFHMFGNDVVNDEQVEIVIIEQLDGRVVTIPNDKKLFQFV